MRIITANVNGIRSAQSKGFFDWFRAQRADVLCLQETKCHRAQLGERGFFPKGWHVHFHDAESKGYSGVAVYSKREPDAVIDKLGWDEFDREGRYLEARFGDLSIVSLYMPSGSSKEERQQFKYRVMDWILPIFREWQASGRHYVLCGDWNIAHKEIDLKNWRSNQKNSGFLPDERAWLDRLFGEHQWVDAFRAIKPDVPEYTWWSNRGNARANNVGWRIDYHVVSPGLKPALTKASIYRDKWFSDHAPLTIDYAL
ncbi:MAG TPA: exodeoxyribonuclease III [Xanthomonadales bacterium]|nr:exodeoxyribonuclease III [Xanthomonadales bacterium]